MKVFVCYTIPDYIGIDIECIFLKEEDAIAFVNKYNLSTNRDYDRCDYEEYEVL